MAHFEKHSKSVESLIDVTEAMLHAMEKHGVDPETVANRPEFSVLVHFLKSIIDGELNIPNELTETIRNKAEELGIDMKNIKKRLH
jgi:dsDNA-specific endonuclease/ATPase MutS2|tara:strand:+ start:274 stop:531 length:258 start_codon:yes stop_codon:yes gene_type:complete